jgi:hypothetical protein
MLVLLGGFWDGDTIVGRWFCEAAIELLGPLFASVG